MVDLFLTESDQATIITPGRHGDLDRDAHFEIGLRSLPERQGHRFRIAAEPARQGDPKRNRSHFYRSR